MDLDGVLVTLGGIAKGSGMIHPNMATMLSLVTCDAAVDAPVWSEMLKRAVSRSFNVVRSAGTVLARVASCNLHGRALTQSFLCIPSRTGSLQPRGLAALSWAKL
jgi:ArgJ family